MVTINFDNDGTSEQLILSELTDTVATDTITKTFTNNDKFLGSDDYIIIGLLKVDVTNRYFKIYGRRGTQLCYS